MFAILGLMALGTTASADDKDWGNLNRYAKQNQEVKKWPKEQRRVVFMGNSITENWASMRPEFFKRNGYIGRGISGQTSYQFVVRYQQDVIDLKPEVVVINTATNDVAENTGPYNEDRIFANIETMVDQAQANKIKVILTTTLPAARFGWNPRITDAPDKIEKLNARIRNYALKNSIAFVDYYSKMVSGKERALNPAYSNDGVHPTEAGYAVMEPMIKAAIDKVLSSTAERTETVTSPNGNIKMVVTMGERLMLSAFLGDEQILKDCPLSLQVGKEVFGKNPKLSSAKHSKVDETIRPVVPLKFAEVPNKANQLTLSFKGGISIDLRAYDNGVAYRFAINKGKGQVDVVSEGLELRLPEAFTAHISKTRGFFTSYENPYTHVSTAELKDGDEMTYLPVLFETPKGTKVLFSESDVHDYPHLFLAPTGHNGFEARFPKSPETWEPSGDRSWKVTKERDCIARTDGRRTLPWRFAVIGNDADIALNQMEAVLGGKCELDDTSWIKPGKVNWDWWNHWTVWGVDFETGINNDTYKYIIDCASKFGVEYILLDEGWNKRVQDPFTTRDEINVKELVDYGAQKNVGVWLWLSWLTVEQHMDLIPYYAAMGVKGLKVDFMDHSDQWMVNYFERVARECAKYHLMVDFHGSFKPAGLEQRLPNLISYEGVRGLEQGGGCRPENSIWLPFMRNAVGPMDFTPGAMENAQPNENRGTADRPMGGGTRVYQMALYVCFESGLQMLADSPTRYLREAECTEYIASVPTTWDETLVLSARAGDHYVVAKRKGTKWFIGAITGDKQQDLDISLDFLSGKGHMTCFQDGRNAHRIAVDYKRLQQDVTPQSQLHLHLARNGGWCAVIEI